MLNPISTYAECGERAAQAMNQRDQSRYAFQNDWYRRAMRMESEGADRQAATQAYEDAFRANRAVPSVSYFR